MGLLGGHSPLVLTLPGVTKDEQFLKQMARTISMVGGLTTLSILLGQIILALLIFKWWSSDDCL